MEEAIQYTLSAHAMTVMSERNISAIWIEQVLSAPMQVIADRVDPELNHALGRISEYNDRVLRVVYNVRVTPW